MMTNLFVHGIPSGVEPDIAANLPVQTGCHGFHACDHENQVHQKNYQLNVLNQNMNDAEKSDGAIKPALIRQSTNVNRIVSNKE